MLKSMFIICISVAFYLFLGFWQVFSQNNHEDIQIKRMKEETQEHFKNTGKQKSIEKIEEASLSDK